MLPIFQKMPRPRKRRRIVRGLTAGMQHAAFGGGPAVCRPQRNPSHLFEETDITVGEDSKAGPTQDLLDMQSLPDVP